jgi:hypothetical protein
MSWIPMDWQLFRNKATVSSVTVVFGFGTSIAFGMLPLTVVFGPGLLCE